MRRLALVALLVAAVTAPSASAQSPIAGGGSSNDAPVLAPGRYRDTLRGGEQLFYAVSLKPGQKLTAGLTVSGRTDATQRDPASSAGGAALAGGGVGSGAGGAGTVAPRGVPQCGQNRARSSS